MTENNYSYVIEFGKTKFYKNGRFMTFSEVLNELEVKDMIINQFSEENKKFDEWYKVLRKYGITSPDKLDQVLRNERVW